MNFIKGQSVARIMTRYNPQLGMYVVVTKATIKSATKTGYSIINEMNSIEKYDLVGNRKNTPTSSYGSSEYSIMSEKDVVAFINNPAHSELKIRGYLCESAKCVLNDAGKKLLNNINSILQGKES